MFTNDVKKWEDIKDILETIYFHVKNKTFRSKFYETVESVVETSGYILPVDINSNISKMNYVLKMSPVSIHINNDKKLEECEVWTKSGRVYFSLFVIYKTVNNQWFVQDLISRTPFVEQEHISELHDTLDKIFSIVYEKFYNETEQKYNWLALARV